MSLFTLIMPTKNRSKHIKNSIQSITAQTETNWELIIIDDHGTDDTEVIIESFNNPKIKYYKLTDLATGPGAARDYGIKKATGDYIVIADSDDINKPNRLEILRNAISENPAVDVFYGDLEIIRDDETIISKSCPFNAELLKRYNFIFNPASCFKKETYLKSAGYDLDLFTSEDYDLWLSLLEVQAKFIYIPEIMTEKIDHSESITINTDFDFRKNNLLKVREKHNLPIPNSSEVEKILPDYIWQRINQKRGLEFWFN